MSFLCQHGNHMPRLINSALLAASLMLLVGCSNQERDRAEQKANQAGQEAKHEAKVLDAKVNQALRTGQPGETAEQKLDHAAIIAKVKANLATNVGLTAAATIGVDAAGSVVTLTGTLPTADARQNAEKSASQVDGVTKVIDRIAVTPN